MYVEINKIKNKIKNKINNKNVFRTSFDWLSFSLAQYFSNFGVRGPFFHSQTSVSPCLKYHPQRKVKTKKGHHFEIVSDFFLFVQKVQQIPKKCFFSWPPSRSPVSSSGPHGSFENPCFHLHRI